MNILIRKLSIRECELMEVRWRLNYFSIIQLYKMLDRVIIGREVAEGSVAGGFW